MRSGKVTKRPPAKARAARQVVAAASLAALVALAAASPLPGHVVSSIPSEYRAGVLGLGAVAILFGLLSLYHGGRSRRAQHSAASDPLTGLSNRQGFEQRLSQEWRRADRYGHPLGMLLLDLDGLKRINDTEGHMAGDRVLREAAAVIAGRIRESDHAGRLGGDEFVVLCPETGLSGLASIAEDLGECLARSSIGATVGYAEREPSDGDAAELVARADTAMYERKRRRRRVARV